MDKLFTITRYTPLVTQSAHYDPWARISILLTGALSEETAKRRVQVAPLDIVIKSDRIKHETRFGAAGATVLSIKVDPLLLKNIEGKAANDYWAWTQHKAALPYTLQLLEAISSADKISIDNILINVVETQRDGLDSSTRHRIPSSRLKKIRHSIYEDPAVTPNVTALAKTEGIHPVSLSRSYRLTYGVSIQEDLQVRRVQLAAAMLADDNNNLKDIAQSTGFFDQSHFTRVFRRHTHMTPGTFRHQMHTLLNA